MTKKEILQNLYQIQELMNSEIFKVEIDIVPNKNDNDKLNNDLLTALEIVTEKYKKSNI